MRAFVGKGNERKVYSRNNCHGYKKLVLDESVTMASTLKFETDNDSLVVRNDETVSPKENTNPQYTFMCKEFGVYEERKDMFAKVSVIFCDDGWMMVTLLDGTLLLNIDGKVVQPVLGMEETPSVKEDEIFWVNQDFFLSRVGYIGEKNKYANKNTQDFEYVFRVAGSYIGGSESTSLRMFVEEFQDLSMGYTAMLEQQDEKKAQAKSAKNLVSSLLSRDDDEEDEFDLSKHEYDDEDDFDDDDDYEDDEDY